jgi:hypothetical protein
VGVDRDVGAARHGRQLELGELEDDPVPLGQLRQSLHQRRADIAAQEDRFGTLPEHGGGQRARGRLALRAGDADRQRRAQAQEEVDLAHDRHLALRFHRAERCAQAWLGGREAAADRR